MDLNPWECDTFLKMTLDSCAVKPATLPIGMVCLRCLRVAGFNGKVHCHRLKYHFFSTCISVDLIIFYLPTILLVFDQTRKILSPSLYTTAIISCPTATQSTGMIVCWHFSPGHKKPFPAIFCKSRCCENYMNKPAWVFFWSFGNPVSSLEHSATFPIFFFQLS